MKDQIRSLRTLLASMSGQERTAFLAARPGVLQQPRPQTLHQLAARLLGTARLSPAALNLGEHQLLEAAVALADHTRRPGEPFGCDRADLNALIGVGQAVPVERLDEVLRSLTVQSLAWPDGDRVLIHPDATVLYPTALGRSPHGRPAMPATAPLALAAPAPDLHAVPGAGTGSGAAALHHTDTLLEAFAEPWPALKQGGLSVRDVRRLARILHCPEAEARLWLHLAVNLDLVAERYSRWKITDRAAAWTRTAPADRLAYLVAALGALQLLPGLSGAEPKLLNQFAPAPAGPSPHYSATTLRHAVLHVLADLPPGQAAIDGPALAATVNYRSPRLFEPYDPDAQPAPPRPDPFGWNPPKPRADEVTTTVLREAELLALTDQGALTPLGRAFLHDPAGHADLRAAAEAALPLQDKAAILADHTVLVPGTPAPALTAVLRTTATLEFRDTRTETWRITPDSVRRHFDLHADTDPQQLLNTLTSISTTPLPQTVAYLVTDTAARHGHIAVAKAGTVLDVRDAALAAELAHRRDLARLQLRQTGPTVLLSPLSPDTVLEALRGAGYAPAGRQTNRAPDEVDDRGAQYEPPQILLPQQKRRATTPMEVDREQWLAALLADEDEPGSELARRIRDRAPNLGAADCTALATAITAGPDTRVHVEYRTASRTHTTVTVRGPRLDHLNRLTSAAGRSPLPLSLASLQVVLPLPEGRKRPGRST